MFRGQNSIGVEDVSSYFSISAGFADLLAIQFEDDAGGISGFHRDFFAGPHGSVGRCD